MSNFADGILIVCHIKGEIHYLAGDINGDHQAMKSSNRRVEVIGGTVAGTLTGGPVGAVVGSIAGGTTMDGIITGVDSTVHD